MVDLFDPDPPVQVAERNSQQALLQAILQQLLPRIRREQFETWFRSLALVRADDREVEFSVTSQFVRDWLNRNFHAAIQESVQAAAGSRRRILISLREEDSWDSLGLLPQLDDQAPLARDVNTIVARLDQTTDRLGSVPPPIAAPIAGPFTKHELVLNPNYTFDKFVCGPCNRLAHAAALAAGENPGSAYNPLFIHGNVGLGKTHLLQAICQAVRQRDPHARVLYLSCEDFTNTYIQAIQGGDLRTFREIHRSVDVLVVDDVQFLANKDKTQEEFFHTFNSLYDAQKQIVVSSDRSPSEIPSIEERLVSRFKWGLVAMVEAPCFDTRIAIVRKKAKGRGVDLDDDVAACIAERITTNIRELEGAVIKVVGIATITGRPITRELAEEALRGVAVRQTTVAGDDVMSLITSEFAITARDLTGKSRTQAVSLPRQISMYLLREHTEMSLEDIGRVFGNRDHTTVLYAVTKIRERCQKDRIFKEMLDGLGTRLVTRTFR